MKKFIVLITALLAALLIAGCASKPAAPTGPSAAELMSDAKNSAPSDAIVGQATARSGKDRAEQNAINQIVRGLGSLVAEMVDEQSAAGRLSATVASDFKQAVVTALSKSNLGSVKKVDSGVSAAGEGWAVYALGKAETLAEVTKAVNLAKETVAAGNFNLSNFDAKFAAAAGKEWKVN
jgi:curli biogenesis system outer membrane secretion channel CsgG